MHTRHLALPALLALSALALTGCANGPDATLGDPIETGLWAQTEFDEGTVAITANSFEPITDDTLARWELDAGDQDAYMARFTVDVVDGTWGDGDRTLAFDNKQWVVNADGDWIKGPNRNAIDLYSPDIDDEECPNDSETVQTALKTDGSVEVCALLLAPGGATVDEIGYAGAKKEGGRRSLGGATIINWSLDKTS